MINTANETSRCLLCTDAPCTKACVKNLDPARGVRAMRFENDDCAGMFFNREACADCDAPCEKACIHYDFPIRLKKLAETVNNEPSEANEADLSIDFCGVKCENPFFLGSSVIANCYDMIARAFDMGWGGVMYKTICFEDMQEVSPRFDRIDKKGMPFVGFRNMEQLSEHTPEQDFEVISRLKKDFPTKIVVASIMGRDEEEWTKLASMAEKAGADMVECNFSCPQMTVEGMGSDVGQNNDLVRTYSAAAKKGCSIPVIAKMTPNITHIAEPSLASVEGGADAIAAINTIKSVTFHTRSEVSGQKTVSGYSGKAVKPIAERMILEIATAPGMENTPLSGIGGVETWQDALEYIQLGCSNVQVCTSVMEYGYRIIDDLKLGLANYMKKNGIEHVSDMVGAALQKFVQPSELDRATYVLPRFDHEKCIGCGRCYTSCYDGGHQAIKFDATTRRASLIGPRCVGCHLCLLVCPVGAISAGKRIPKKFHENSRKFAKIRVAERCVIKELQFVELTLFYKSEMLPLLAEGVADLHCRSDNSRLIHDNSHLKPHFFEQNPEQIAIKFTKRANSHQKNFFLHKKVVPCRNNYKIILKKILYKNI